MRRMKNTKKLTSFLFLTAIVLLVAGFSFAYFSFSKVQTDYSLIVGGGTVNLNFEYSTDYYIPDMPCTEREAMKYTPITFNVKGINDKGNSIFYEISFDDLISAADETLFNDTDIIQFSLKKNGDFIYREKSYDDFDGEIIDIGSITPKSGMSVNDKYELWLWIRDDVLVSDSPKYTQGFYKVFDTLSFDKKVALTGISINAYEGLGVTLKTNFEETTTHKILVEAPNLYTSGNYIQLTNAVPLITTTQPSTYGYSFNGWSESKNGPVIYYPGDIITESKTLYAQYTNRAALLSPFSTISSAAYTANAYSEMNWPESSWYQNTVRPYVKEIYFAYTTQAFGRAGVDSGYYDYYLISSHNLGLYTDQNEPTLITDDIYVKWDNTNKILRIESPSSINFYSSSSSASLFYNSPNLYTISFLNFNFRFDMNDSLFYSCSSLRNIDLTGVYFNRKNSNTLYNSFRKCTNLVEVTLPKLIDNPDVQYDMFCCFASDPNLKKINYEAFNHQNFSRLLQFLYGTKIEEFDMSYMSFPENSSLQDAFRNTSMLTEFHIQGTDYSKVTNMLGFLTESKVKRVDMSYLDLSSCTTFESMFSRNSNLEFVRLDNIVMPNVQSLQKICELCTNLVTFYLNNTDLSSVTTLSGMFYTCGSLRAFEWSGKPCKSTESVQEMFYGCKNLVVADVSMVDPENLTSAANTFYQCSNLTTILSNCNWYNLETANHIFSFASKLVGGNGSKRAVEDQSNPYRCAIDDEIPGCFTLKDPNAVYDHRRGAQILTT